MDRVASPSELNRVITGAATEIQGVAGQIAPQAASAMRDLRTRLARVNT